MTQLSDAGFTLSRLSDRVAQLAAAVQAIPGLGPTVNLDPNSVDGMMLGIWAESISNLDLLAQSVYQSFNVDTATGVALSRLARLARLSRNLGSYSTVPLTFTGTVNSAVAAGTLVTSADGSSVWQTLAAVAIGSSGQVTTQAQPTPGTGLGPVSAAIGTLTQLSTIAYGVQTVTNYTPATLGTLEETDEALRLRMNSSTAAAAQGITAAIKGALENLSGVVLAVVLENLTDVTDANGLPPGCLNIIVQGGFPQDILQTIYLKMSSGTPLVGARSGYALDSYNGLHLIHYDVPTLVPVWLTVNLKRLAGYPTNGATLIANALIAYGAAQLKVGSAVIKSSLYAAITSVPSVSVTDVLLGTAPSPSLNQDLQIAFNAIAVFDPSRITINAS